MGEVLLERDGNIVPDQARKLCRWEQHFKELLIHVAPPNSAFSPLRPLRRKPTLVKLTQEEVCTVTRQLCNNRAPGEDGIPAEVYKTCLDSLGPWLHRVITKVWLCEAVPNNWIEAVLLSLFKKGDKPICSNNRGISLIYVAAKVFGVILLKRFQSERDQRTRPHQSGFRPGYACTDQIHNLRRTLEQRWNYQQATVMCFIDFASALDSVDRDSLWRIMAADGMPPQTLEAYQGVLLVDQDEG